MALWCVADEDRRTALLERGAQIYEGYLMNYAMNAPKELAAESRRHQAMLQAPLHGAARSQALDEALAQLRDAGRTA
jgi:hypothetical protein